ncbi:DUF6978 family protein [Gardnerella vaginalis]|uniref:Prophage protein n=1 Tax=Gardnerella vaginalis TaxID=2702 RepID=A0A2K1STX1_GARVA|nr:hypothetical protein [Gardnerella vaginalis]PNS42979.1 hypothetical protein BFS05_05130 [Gardnerella vaginalis]
MSRKPVVPRFTLTQSEANLLIAETKRAVEKVVNMPAQGVHNAEFHVKSKENSFTIALYRGRINANKHTLSARTSSARTLSARISVSGIPLIRLCVNGSTHTNPDGTRVGGTHWHIYREGFDDSFAVAANINSPDFVRDTILLLDKFNVIQKPKFQGALL